MDANDIRVARGVQFDLNLIVLSCTKPHDYLWSYRLSTGRSMKHCALTGGWWTKIWTTEPSLFTHTRNMSSVERKLKCAEECLIVWSSTQLRRKVVHNEKRKTKGRKKFEGGVKKNSKYVKKKISRGSIWRAIVVRIIHKKREWNRSSGFWVFPLKFSHSTYTIYRNKFRWITKIYVIEHTKRNYCGRTVLLNVSPSVEKWSMV